MSTARARTDCLGYTILGEHDLHNLKPSPGHSDKEPSIWDVSMDLSNGSQRLDELAYGESLYLEPYSQIAMRLITDGYPPNTYATCSRKSKAKTVELEIDNKNIYRALGHTVYKKR